MRGFVFLGICTVDQAAVGGDRRRKIERAGVRREEGPAMRPPAPGHKKSGPRDSSSRGTAGPSGKGGSGPYYVGCLSSLVGVSELEFDGFSFRKRTEAIGFDG